MREDNLHDDNNTTSPLFVCFELAFDCAGLFGSNSLDHSMVVWLELDEDKLVPLRAIRFGLMALSAVGKTTCI